MDGVPMLKEVLNQVFPYITLINLTAADDMIVFTFRADTDIQEIAPLFPEVLQYKNLYYKNTFIFRYDFELDNKPVAAGFSVVYQYQVGVIDRPYRIDAKTILSNLLNMNDSVIEEIKRETQRQ